MYKEDIRTEALKREWAVALNIDDKAEYGIPPYPKDVEKVAHGGVLALYKKGAGQAFIRCENPMIVRR